jgi:hypothetical protein
VIRPGVEIGWCRIEALVARGGMMRVWLAATRFHAPDAAAFLQEHRRRAEAARAAKKAFLNE